MLQSGGIKWNKIIKKATHLATVYIYRYLSLEQFYTDVHLQDANLCLNGTYHQTD